MILCCVEESPTGAADGSGQQRMLLKVCVCVAFGIKLEPWVVWPLWSMCVSMKGGWVRRTSDGEEFLITPPPQHPPPPSQSLVFLSSGSHHHDI